MTFLKNIKIRTRLLGAFLAVAFIAALVGAVGSVNLNTVNQQGRWMYEKTTMPLGQLGLVMRDFQGIRITVYQGLRAPNPDAARERFSTLSGNEARITQQLDAYTKTFIDAGDKEQHDKLVSQLDAYYKALEPVIMAKSSGQEPDPTAMKVGATAADDVLTTLNSMVLSNIAAAKIAADNNEAVTAHANLVMWSCIAIAVALSVALGIFVTRSLTQPIAGFMQVLERVAEGNFTVEADASTRDEIGALGKDLNHTLHALRASITEAISAAMTVSSGATELSAAAEEMSATTNEIARTAHDLAEVASRLATVMGRFTV